MNTGQQTIDWLYRQQLQVDKEWSEVLGNGFRWWPGPQAQVIEIVGEEIGPDGNTGYFVCVRTECMKEVPTRVALKLNAIARAPVSMSGLVLDAEEGTMSLASMVRVHAVIREWMQPMISVAAALQIEESRLLALNLCEAIGAVAAHSAPRGKSVRSEPDEIASIAQALVVPTGAGPASWEEDEFARAVREHMQQPPAVLATFGGRNFTVEFPFGESATSLCVASSEHAHPIYGNGLSMTQSFPLDAEDDEVGASMALMYNAQELRCRPEGYGFGCYSFSDGKLEFRSFIPNLLHRPGFLLNLFYACAGRARAKSIQLTGCDWTSSSFSFDRSGFARWMRSRGDT